MNLNFQQPLSNGFMRMKKALFQPFDLSKWINIGFTAFLAGLTDCGGGGGYGNGNSGFRGNHHFNWDKFFNFPQLAWDWLISHPLWFGLIITGIFFLLTVTIIISWISCRGKFMFLFNVVNDTQDVVKPWKEYRSEGNSLFWWRFVYGWLVFVLFILFFACSFGVIKNVYYDIIPAAAKFGFIAGMICTLIALLVITGYISLFLNDFIVPLMYKYRISATKAWLKFLTLALHNTGSFLVYGIFIFVLSIAVGIGVIILAVMTCCIGLLLLIIPFVGSVILLPVSYTFRAFSIEYLASFGTEYALLPENTSEETQQQNN